MDLATFKQSQRAAWAAGDYPPVGRLIEPAARTLVDRVGITTGQRVLDVATGSGSVAIAAGGAGARVLGVDITDAWFDHARQRAVAAGIELELEVGDAEDLPVDDASFDVVLSSFGAIFAPRHEIVAGELARVCRPGGTIAFTAWTAGGPNDDVFSSIIDHLPEPPEFVEPSLRWGDPDHVTALFAPHPVTFAFEHDAFTVEFASIDAFETFALTTSGPIMAAKDALEELGRWPTAHSAMRTAMEATNEADDGTYRATWDHLTAIGSKGAP